MFKEPLISVIVNCYNGEKFINRCIASILEQTYKNFEIIFWNNKSTDNTLRIIQKFSDIRIKIFNSEIHTNISCARNEAIKRSKGEYISFLDIDDYWDQNKLEHQLKSFTSEEIGFSFTNFWYVNSQKKIETKRMVNLKFENGLINKMIKNYEIVLSTIMVRKKILEKLIKPFNEDYHIIGDFDFSLNLAKITKFYHVKSYLAYRVWHGENESLKKHEITISEIEKWLIKNSSHLNKYNSEILFLKKRIYYNKINLNIKKKNLIKAFNVFLKASLNFKISYLKNYSLKFYKIFKKLFHVKISKMIIF